MAPVHTAPRTDPLAPAGLFLALLPFPLGLVVAVDWWWRLLAALIGGGLGVASLARLRRSDGALGGRGLAVAATAVGLAVCAAIVAVLATFLLVFVATGSG